MSLKKLSSVVLLCIMFSMLFTGCGDSAKPVSMRTIGVITKLNLSDSTLNEKFSKLDTSAQNSSVEIKQKYVYYKSLDEMLKALHTRKINEAVTYKSVARYVIGQNSDLAQATKSGSYSDSFCLAVRKEDKALLDSLNNALQAMNSEGTTSYIAKTYIEFLNPNDEVPITDMPKIDSTETIKVGVTGDFPPFDLINKSGVPAGFSTTLLAELSRRTWKNVEIVKISADERARALTSKRIDVAFWATVSNEKSLPKDMDKPAELELTTPYFEDEIAYLVLKK